MQQNKTIPAEAKETAPANRSILLARKKIEVNRTIQSESDKLVKLFGNMAAVPTYLVDEPIIDKGDETERASAYTICENDREPVILVKRKFYEKNKPQQVQKILRHELTHAWFCRRGERVGHDQRFRDKMKDIGEPGD